MEAINFWFESGPSRLKHLLFRVDQTSLLGVVIARTWKPVLVRLNEEIFCFSCTIHKTSAASDLEDLLSIVMRLLQTVIESRGNYLLKGIDRTSSMRIFKALYTWSKKLKGLWLRNGTSAKCAGILNVRARAGYRKHASIVILALLTEIIKVISDTGVRSLLTERLLNDSRPIPWLSRNSRVLNLIAGILIPILITSRAYLGLSRLDNEGVLSRGLACTKFNIALSRSLMNTLL
jgi:hypothetical protein